MADSLPTEAAWPARLPQPAPETEAEAVLLGGPAWGEAQPALLALVDAVVDDDDQMAAAVATCELAPLAALALVRLLRIAHTSIAAGLEAESATYSALQRGPEFLSWRAATTRRSRPNPSGPVVLLDRRGDELEIVLARPEVRNVLGVQMRDELLDGLAVAEADPALRVTIRGEGPDFCAGGDLDEFGTFPDPDTAHQIRLERSIGAVLARLAARTTVHLHGACYGSGIELPAFAGHVVADPGTTIALPELGLGLVPGAGGTVSLPARIGRHATARLALTRLPIGASEALRLGLVDEVVL